MLRTLRRLCANLAPLRRANRRATLRLEVLEDRATPTVGFDWASTALLNGASVGWERAEDIAIDGAGSSYVVGSLNGTADFDTADTDPGTNAGLVLTTNTIPNPGSPTGFTYLPSGYVARYNASGQCVWAVALTPAFSGAVASAGSAIAYDASNGGRLVVTGYRATSTTAGASGQDGIVAWLSASTGAVEAVQTFGGTRDNDYGADVAVDSAGNAYVAGAIENAPASIFVNRDIYVARFHANTSRAWERVVGGSSCADAARAVAVDGGGNALIGGFFQQTVDFDPGPGTYSLFTGGSKTLVVPAGFVLKLSNDGVFRWADHFQLANNSRSDVKDLVVAGNGNVTVLGSYSGTVDLDPGKKASKKVTGAGAFLVQLDSQGSFVWARTTSILFEAMALGGDGNIYLTGADGNGQGCIAQVDRSNGDSVQTITIAAPGSCLAVDGTGNIYLAGTFTGTDVDFDFTTGTWLLSAENGQAGMFVMKLHW